MRSGARWRDIPREPIAPCTTVYSRHRNWVQSRFWRKLFQRLNGLRQRVDLLDWSTDFVVGTTIPVHQKATEDSPCSEAFGLSRGGLTTQVHVQLDRDGHLLNVGEHGRPTTGVGRLQRVDEKRSCRKSVGTPEITAEAVVGDEGFNAHWVHD
jgi:hypothetical protein